MNAGARRFLVALALCLVALGASAGAAGAHPLGNFTTNQLVQVRIDRDQAVAHYILDQAEIPTFQALQQHGASSAAELDAAEEQAIADEILAEVSEGLTLRANGGPVAVGEPTDVALSFPAGQGGLDLTRLEADFATPLPEDVTDVAVDNGAFAGRRGWTAVQVLAGGGTDVVSSVPATDPTDGLRGYPSDLLSSPSDERSASFEVSPGNGAVTAPEGLTSDEETTSDRSPDGFANTLASGDAHGLLILFLLAAAFGWGALHALSPGHGKAMVAGYLVGARGTPRHAAILGVTVTVTHTISVFALGLVTLALSQYVLPEDLYPWLTLSSGVLVIAIGLSVMRSRFARWRRLRRPSVADHPHDHSHAPEGTITMRSLLALGVSGGMVPCPSALVVLIAAISQHRVGLGMLLITAFSLGLAATMTAVGLAVIWGGRAIRRLRPDRALFGSRLAGALPALSASIIVLAGVLISLRALPELGA
jgi:nickel/cobalt exporter